MNDLDPTHEAIRTAWRTKIASLISGEALKPLQPIPDNEQIGEEE